MIESADAVLDWLLTIPDAFVYLILGIAAAVENVVPPIPADVMVLMGGVVAGAGSVGPWRLFFAVWFGNVASALAIYWVGRRYGAGFFHRPVGRFLLAPSQVDALSRAYRRFGFPIIFLSRFLPVFRPIVPVFAGVSGLGFWRTALPVAAASAIWYGLLVYLGNAAGENWREVLNFVQRFGTWMWIAAGVALLAMVLWWHRTRRELLDAMDGP